MNGFRMCNLQNQTKEGKIGLCRYNTRREDIMDKILNGNICLGLKYLKKNMGWSFDLRL